MQDHFTERIITIYCLCDDFLRAWGHTDVPQAKLTTAQVMTVALVASALFGGNQERSRCFLKEHGYIQPMPCKSVLNRRLHGIPEALWQALFALLAAAHKQTNEDQQSAVDSLPVAVCDNYRICRSRLYPRKTHGEAFRGYLPSKRRFFYGLRVHLLMTTEGLPTEGLPVEVLLAPASQADIRVFRRLPLELPPDAYVFADAGYVDQHEEALLKEAAEVHLVALRRAKTKTPLVPWLSYVVRRKRKYIETVFSQIASALGRTVHAVTPRGFELKVFLTVLAFAITAAL